jgi:hypothetical protein
MHLNLNHPHALLNRRNLLAAGLGVYWCIVFQLNYFALPEKALGDREMMKLVGGQSGGNDGSCTQLMTCVDQDCKMCPKAGEDCKDNQQKGYTAENCASGGSKLNCTTGSPTLRILCNDYYSCDCTMQGCVQSQTKLNPGCIGSDVGTPKAGCNYTVAPPGC